MLFMFEWGERRREFSEEFRRIVNLFGECSAKTHVPSCIDITPKTLTGSSRSGSSRGSGSRLSGSSPLLQVLLERRSGRDTLTRILVDAGLGVTGVGHSSASNVLVECGSAGELGRGGEGGGRGDEGESDDLHG